MEHCQNSDCKHSFRVDVGQQQTKSEMDERGGKTNFDGLAKHDINTNRIVDEKTLGQYGGRSDVNRRNKNKMKGQETNDVFLSACLLPSTIF